MQPEIVANSSDSAPKTHRKYFEVRLHWILLNRVWMRNKKIRITDDNIESLQSSRRYVVT